MRENGIINMRGCALQKDVQRYSIVVITLHLIIYIFMQIRGEYPRAETRAGAPGPKGLKGRKGAN